MNWMNEWIIHFGNKTTWSDEATFHVSDKIIHHHMRVWGSQRSNDVRAVEKDSPKLNVRCALSMNEVIGPYFFEGNVITSEDYLTMLQEIGATKYQMTKCFSKMGHHHTLQEQWRPTWTPFREDGLVEPRSHRMATAITWSDFSFFFFFGGDTSRTQSTSTILVGSTDNLRARITDACGTVNSEILRKIGKKSYPKFMANMFTTSLIKTYYI